ncbi:MAG: YnbE family lipoprotein [Gammaproteobacteria bacterium]|nr:YnbE family lipoprotein [Gammaproteobacteria bacterium]
MNPIPEPHHRHRRPLLSCGLLAASLALYACTPTVKVDTSEPITINLNVNIKHEILVKVDRELENVLSEDSGLF